MRTGIVFLLGAVAVSAVETTAAERPNILIILADDLGREWLSCYGSEHTTPHIDALATGGVRFETCYATPLCTPTRHELLTGRYPFRTGWTTHHDAPRWGGQYFDWKREFTFARMLRDAGYATAIAGKWQVNDLRAQPQALREHGFGEHCLWPGFETGNPESEARYFDPFLQTNGKRGIRKGAFGPDVCREFLIDFMARHRTVPFCAYYASILVHSPYTKTPHNLQANLNGTQFYAGMVDYLDYEVGCLVKALEDLKIRDKTIILFASDNGGPGVTCRANNRDIKGAKGEVTEAGVLVPFIANAPGLVLAGKVSDELIDFTDVFPTLAALTGAKLPPDIVLDDERAKRVIRDQRFKLYWDGRFYDVVADPAEKFDLSGSDNRQAITAREKLEKALRSLPPDATLPFAPRPPEPPKKKSVRDKTFEQPVGPVRDPGDLR